LFDGVSVQEESQAPVPKKEEPSLGAVPEMTGEENMLINRGRFGVDPE